MNAHEREEADPLISEERKVYSHCGSTFLSRNGLQAMEVGLM
jgi:hypothetical protein